MKLEIGFNHPFEIRKETFFYPVQNNFSLLYLSDFHFTSFSSVIVEKIIDAIILLNPDVILMGGDYADSLAGIDRLNYFLKCISYKTNIFAVTGNHDSRFYEEISKAFTKHGIHLMDHTSIELTLRNTTIKIDGKKLDKENNTDSFNVLLMHQPWDLNKFYPFYDLAFAGHLHGSQMVWWKKKEKLYPGKLFYKWNLLKAEKENCQFLISKGLGDTLPIRYNCKKDIIFVEIYKK